MSACAASCDFERAAVWCPKRPASSLQQSLYFKLQVAKQVERVCCIVPSCLLGLSLTVRLASESHSR